MIPTQSETQEEEKALERCQCVQCGFLQFKAWENIDKTAENILVGQ